jgi:hypothetical protein
MITLLLIINKCNLILTQTGCSNVSLMNVYNGSLDSVKAATFLTNSATVSFSRKILRHGIIVVKVSIKKNR